MKLQIAVSRASLIFQRNKAKNNNLKNMKNLTTEIILRCTPCKGFRSQCTCIWQPHYVNMPMQYTAILTAVKMTYGRRSGVVLERQTPEREVGARSSLRSPFCVLEQDTFTSQKVLVIPRKRGLRPDMIEKLFTGTLSKNKTKRNEKRQFSDEKL